MTSEIDRKIAVIFVADVVGYSKHMERDENATLKAYAECEKILKSCLKKYKGSIFNTAGDSALVEFPSAVNAVECGAAFQSEVKKRNVSEKTEVKLEFRIGINMGDVVKREGNLLGDGVNIAARLEALSQPNSICVSKSVYDLVVSKTTMIFNDLGVQKVKQNEFHAFDILLDPSQKRTLKTKSGYVIPVISTVAAALLLIVGVFYFTSFQNISSKSKPIISADKQSILVMNFENLTNNEDNGFLVTGITTSIRSVLNNTESVKVPPSSTTNFIAKNKYDNTQIYEKYGFDFILRGNVQGAGKKTRIAVEMTDLNKENIIYSDIYDFDETKDIFDLQDEIALSILQANRITSKYARPELASNDPKLYKMHIKAHSLFQQNTRESNKKAENLWKRMLEKEPDNFRFMNSLGWVYWQKIMLRISDNPKDDIQKGLTLANKALSIRQTHAPALSLELSLGLMMGNHDKVCKKVEQIFQYSETIFDTALGAAGAHGCGDLESAISNYEYVLNSAPHFSSWARNSYSYALVENGNFDKALKFFEAELQKDHAFKGFPQTMYLLSAYINKKRGNEKKAVDFFAKQKNEDGKGKSAKRIRGELSMLKNKDFIDDLINELSSLGLT
jgi:class 3 adenylate cyclase/TolB-like protein